jgi:cytochrome c oxidase subunit II
MNCVPGMVTNFSFVPTVTTQEMRDNENMVAKVDNINKIRTKKSVDLVAQGKEALDPYTFDYLLLCNKICGASHYNMQMKVVVDTPQDFKNWLKGKSLLSKEIKDAALANEAEKVQVSGSAKETETIKIDTALVAKAEMN